MSELTKTIHQVGEMVGIPARDTDTILRRVKANQSLLENCAGPHDFSICLDRHTKQPIQRPTPAQLFGAYWQCSRCGGYVEATNKSWYNRGLKQTNQRLVELLEKCEQYLTSEESSIDVTVTDYAILVEELRAEIKKVKEPTK